MIGSIKNLRHTRRVVRTRIDGVEQGYWVSQKPKECDPRRHICSVEQWFKEKDRLAKLSPIKALEGAKDVFSEEVWAEIEVAESFREREVRSYDYSDLIYLKEEIRELEKKIKKYPWSRREELERKKARYMDILSVENRLFKKAVREKNVRGVEIGIYRRLSDRIIYSVTADIIEVVELYFRGLDVKEIHLRHPEIPKKDIQEIVTVIKKNER